MLKPTLPAARAVAATLLAAAALAPAAYSVATPSRPYDAAANDQRFDKVWRTARDNFYDPRMKGLDWNAEAARYRPMAEAARTKEQFEAVVNQMLAELRASHTGYYTDDEMEFYLLTSLFKGDFDQTKMDHIGVMGERDKGGAFVVKAVLDGGPAARAGLRRGDRILEANGGPFTTVGSFRGHAGQPTELLIERGGRQERVSVTPVSENPQRAFLDATKRSARVFESGGRRIGYIHLWTMTDERLKQALDAALLGPLADTDGLILDLRDGFGGRPSGFTDVLFRPDVVMTSTYRDHPPSTAHTGYSRPLVVLIDEGTRSAKEWFAYQIKKSGRGALVGANTAGAFLGAGGFPIASDGYLELPVVNLRLDGRWLEGVGVAPDVAVPSDTAYAPDDRQLARGLSVLLARIKAAQKDVIVP